MKNKMKFWRRMGNQVSITDVEVMRDQDGIEREVEVSRVLTGRQLKAYTYSTGQQKAPVGGLMKKMFVRAGLITIKKEQAVETV